MTVPANTIIVFAAGAPPAVTGAPAVGGPGSGFATSGDQAWAETVEARGQAGALAATPTDFGPWGGSVSFDVSQSWFSGLDPSQTPSGQIDIFRTGLHELGHVFGYGLAGSWDVNTTSGAFTGANAVARFGGPVPLDPARAHWGGGVRDQGVATIMDQFVSGLGYTALDIAGFTDIGWQTSPPPVPPTQKAFAVGAGQGSAPHVKVYNPDGRERFSFFAYDQGYIGGVRVATADVNGDGFEDIITGTTPGTANGHVKVFDGQSGAEIRSFFTMPGVTAGIFVAGGDMNGDGRAEIIVGADAGVADGQVLVYDGATGAQLTDFRAFSAFLGGARVAAGDVTGDGRADIIVGSGFGSTPHVKVFDGNGFGLVRSFFAYQSTFQGGVFVGAADFNGDNVFDIVTGAGTGTGTHVRVIDGLRASETGSAGEIVDGAQFASFITTGPDGFRGGPVSVADVNGDGQSDILLELTGAPNSQVRALNTFSQGVFYILEPFPGFAGDIFVG